MPHPFPSLPPHQRGQVLPFQNASEALEGNPWGDPAERDVFVYTPPGYDPGRRYPAVLLLAPFSGTGESMLARGLTDISMATRIDRLIASGACAPFIAVLPDVMTTLVGSQFVDSPGIGRYATWIAEELLPALDQTFPTTGRWAACGRSSGGFGALHLAMSHPGRLHAVASNAGDMGFDLAYLSEIPGGLGPIRAAGGPMAYVRAFWDESRLGGGDFAAMNLLCTSAAYGRAGEREDDGFPARLPVDWRTGAVDFDRFHGWRRFDPVVRAAEDDDAAAALAALDLLYLHAGEQDEYHLQLGAARLATALAARGVEHVHETFPGGHRGTSWRFDVSLPRLVAALEG
jgi:enterochelin esterase-like enzyme